MWSRASRSVYDSFSLRATAWASWPFVSSSRSSSVRIRLGASAEASAEVVDLGGQGIDLLRGRPTASPHFVVGSVRHGVPPVSGAAVLELTQGPGLHAGMFVPVRSRSRHGSM